MIKILIAFMIFSPMFFVILYIIGDQLKRKKWYKKHVANGSD